MHPAISLKTIISSSYGNPCERGRTGWYLTIEFSR